MWASVPTDLAGAAIRPKESLNSRNAKSKMSSFMDRIQTSEVHNRNVKCDSSLLPEK